MSARGRKPIEDHLRKDNVVRFRLNTQMKDQLKLMAQEKGLNVSVFLTGIVTARLKARSKKVGV
jgi:hypothetical protein